MTKTKKIAGIIGINHEDLIDAIVENSSGGGGGVTSFNTRVGNIISQAGDYQANLITYDNTQSALLAINIQDAIDEVVDNLNNISLSGVTSFNTRTGAVVAEFDDYQANLISYDNINSNLNVNDVQAAIDVIVTDLQPQVLFRKTNLNPINLTTNPAPISFDITQDLFAPITAEACFDVTADEITPLKSGYYKARVVIHAQRDGSGTDGIATFIFYLNGQPVPLTTRNFNIQDNANGAITFEFIFSSYFSSVGVNTLSLVGYADTNNAIQLVSINGAPPVQIIIEKTNNFN